jgi:predicted dehydrogenase
MRKVSGGVNVVVVGLGFGQLHCDNILKTKGLRLLGVCDENMQRLAEAAQKYQVAAYSSFRQVLEDPRVHLVALATPHSMHKDMAVAAMDKGKHVIVEKIMCLNLKEADAMLRARDRNKVMLTVHHNRRYDRDYLTVKKVLESGTLGRQFLIEQRVHFYGFWGGWRQYKKFGGGLINDWGAHLVDQILLLNPGQKVREVFGGFHHQVFKTDTENHASIRMQFENGNEGVAEVGQLCGMRLPRWFVVAEKGSLRLDDERWERRRKGGWDEDHLRLEMHRRVKGKDVKSSIPLLKSSWQHLYQNVHDHLAKGAKLAITAEQVRRVVGVIEAGHRSALARKSVRVQL